MTDCDDDHAPMLFSSIKLPRSTARSTSLSLPPSFDNEGAFVYHTGPLHPQMETLSGLSSRSRRPEMGHWQHGLTRMQTGKHLANPDYPHYDTNVKRSEHLMMSGPLGSCNDPDCTECPSAYKTKRGLSMDKKLHDILYGNNDSWTKKWASRLDTYFPVMNPHNKVVQQWNKFFLISCFVATFIDPLFFFLLSVEGDNKCIIFNWSLATSIAVVRSVTDFIYLLHMILQFRLAYVAPESRVVGAGDLVDQPKKIALNYLCGYFFLDFFILLPLPQVMILAVLPNYVGSSEANYAKNLLRVTVLLQYIPRLIRFIPLLGGRSASGFIVESAWANFVINLFMFVLAGHVVGSCWYLFGLQRVNQCLHDACASSNVTNCRILIDCGRGVDAQEDRDSWKNESTSTACFDSANGGFNYGIYQNLVLLTTEPSAVKRYIYSLFWGFQQISTFAGNQVPSYLPWETLFCMAIIGLGLLLFALLIGNMQNFLLALGRRRVEMQLRRRDVERWMSHRRLPEVLRRKVRQAERFTWAATRGIDEEQLLENLPEDIQREIHRHFFGFLNNVRIFSLMDEPMLDAMYEKLKQKLYVRGSDIFYMGGSVEKMVFVVRGKLESIGADGNIAPLAEGDVCGEELLTWCLEHTSVNREGGKIRFHGSRLFSTRTVKCLTNVEAFVLRAADLEEVTALFSRFLRNPRVQGAIRYESPYWRNIAVTRIQVAWRYRQKRLMRTSTPNN